MDSGHIVMHGTPREIFGRADELKSYRMDVPQSSMLAEELRKRGLDIPKGILRRKSWWKRYVDCVRACKIIYTSPGTAYEKTCAQMISV